MLGSWTMVVAAALVAVGAPLSSTASPDPAGRADPDDVRIIDLNRATLDDLLRFKGIGRQYAERVFQARPYGSRAELVSRGVIPTTVYLAIKHRLYVTLPPTASGEAAPAEPVPLGMIDLNRATRDELLEVPGVGLKYADRIIAARPYRAEIELVGRRVMPLPAFEKVQGYLAVAR